MQKHLVVLSIGPALVDVTIKVKDEVFREICSNLNLSAGGWHSMHTYEEYVHYFSLAFGRDSLPSEKFYRETNAHLIPGSTNLGFLSAFPLKLRKQTGILTASAFNGQGVDFHSIFFQNKVRELGINYYSRPYEGLNPVGLILYSHNERDKVLLNYAGVSRELDFIPRDLECEYIYVDLYELVSGSISSTILRAIYESDLKVILGLSNENVINDASVSTINRLFNSRKVHTIVGNIGEYSKLFNFQPTICYKNPQVLNNLVDEIVDNASVSSFLFTMGLNGMIGYANNEYLYQPALPITNLINSSGAGDIAAGVFVSELIGGSDLSTSLSAAEAWARQILSKRESYLVEGRL